jgi:hypothetical protein
VNGTLPTPLPAMTLRAAAVVPPMVLFAAPSMTMPRWALGYLTVPVKSVPM